MLGYAGEILRINLSDKTVEKQAFSEEQLRRFVGGAGLGIKVITEEVPPQTLWDSPSNKIVFATGPLAGTAYPGSGTICVVSKGALTGGIASSQANGYMGAFLRLNGYDAIILEGSAAEWVYLVVDQGKIEIKDARHLLGLDTWELEETLKKETGYTRSSVFGIGPAGESQVKFAAICGDEGHVAAHNGLGAVMGSKKLKAIVIPRVKAKIALSKEDDFIDAVNKQKTLTRSKPYVNNIEARGTAGGVPGVYSIGLLPKKNYTTNVVEGNAYEKICGQYIRDNFKLQPAPCLPVISNIIVTRWNCQVPLKGMKAEEPEYEAMASVGSNLGIFDLGRWLNWQTTAIDSALMSMKQAGDRLGDGVLREGSFLEGSSLWIGFEMGERRCAYQLLRKNFISGEGLANLLAEESNVPQKHRR